MSRVVFYCLANTCAQCSNTPCIVTFVFIFLFDLIDFKQLHHTLLHIIHRVSMCKIHYRVLMSGKVRSFDFGCYFVYYVIEYLTLPVVFFP